MSRIDIDFNVALKGVGRCKMKNSEFIAKSASEYYFKSYVGVMNKGLAGWVNRKFHKDLENHKFVKEIKSPIVLELGASQDLHRNFVKDDFQSYFVTDLDEKLLNIGAQSSPFDSRVMYQVVDATATPYADNQFDRVIATCLIAHMRYPEDVLQEWRRLVKNTGVLSFYVAAEPSLLLRVARLFTHKISARKLGVVNYDLLQYGGHHSHFPAIKTFINWTFKNDVIDTRRFPAKWLPWNLSFYTVYHIKVKK